MNEIPVEEDVEPLLVTNAARRFVPTIRSKTRGIARYAFSDVPLEDEPALFAELYMSLLEASLVNGWKNRCSSVVEAVDRLAADDFEPGFLMVSAEKIPDICGPDYDSAVVEQLMMTQGYVTVVNGIKVLPAELSPDAAVVTASPEMLGLYTRVGDFLGIMLQRVNRSIMVVGDGVV
jgi:hypothetical protein